MIDSPVLPFGQPPQWKHIPLVPHPLPKPAELPQQMQETLEKCQDQLHENFEEDELLSITDACLKMGISVPTFYNWQTAGRLPVERRGTRVWLKESFCEMVRDLRELHGAKWFDFVSDAYRESSKMAGTPETSTEQQSELDQTLQSEGLNSSDLIKKKVFARARLLHSKGKSEAAMELILFLDELGVEI